MLLQLRKGMWMLRDTSSIITLLTGGAAECY